jgi:putative phosphoesterase
MRILVVSDTHGNQTALLKAYQAAGHLDAVIHLGDGEADAAILAEIENHPVLRVSGNCDSDSTAPRELVCTWQGTRLLLCHGDRYGVKNGLARLVQRGKEVDVDAVLYGHTHLTMAEEHEGLMLINPGTMAYPALFHSYAILEITNDGIQAEITALD